MHWIGQLAPAEGTERVQKQIGTREVLQIGITKAGTTQYAYAYVGAKA